MAPVYKIALIQLQSKPAAVADNFAKAASYIRDAASKGCHLALLPEYYLTSWAPEHPDFFTACAESGAYLAKYQELARELNINIVPGTICEFHPPPGGTTTTATGATAAAAAAASASAAGPKDELRNIAYFIAAGSGEVLASYQKKNLWHPERPHLTSSGAAPHEAFDTPLKHADGRPVRAGMLICWDLAFPEAFRELVSDGADMVIIPSWWYPTDLDEAALTLNPDSEKAFLEATTVARAFENTAAIVFCNAGGLSQVAMPIQGALGKTGVGKEDQMEVVEMDLDVLRVAEQNYKVRQDMRGQGWHYAHTLMREGNTK